MVGTSLLWPGPHPHLISGAPSAAHGVLPAPCLRARQLLLQEHHTGAHPTPSHPRRGQGWITAPVLPVPRVSLSRAGSWQARLLRPGPGPAAFLSPGRTIKAPLLRRVLPRAMFPQLSVCLQSIQTCNSTGSGCLRRRLDYLCFINKARKCKARSPENQLRLAPNGGFFFGTTLLPFAPIYLFSSSIPPPSFCPCPPSYPPSPKTQLNPVSRQRCC